jgi:hypothetical protein
VGPEPVRVLRQREVFLILSSSPSSDTVSTELPHFELLLVVEALNSHGLLTAESPSGNSLDNYWGGV